MLDQQNFLKEIQTTGFSIVSGVIPKLLAKELKAESLGVIEAEREKYGNHENFCFGRILLASQYGGPFLRVYEHGNLMRPFELVLGKECITYALTTSFIPPHQKTFTSNIHVDSPRIILDYVTTLIGLVMLDDFTVENGATYILPQSQHRHEQPEHEEFYKNAKRITGSAGDALFFNARAWHASGENKTDEWRGCLLLGMVRPWMKQRMDIPRVMRNMNLSNVPEVTLQKLGFHCQAPASYDEFYDTNPATKKFKQRVV